jgi:hypothetical protein
MVFRRNLASRDRCHVILSEGDRCAVAGAEGWDGVSPNDGGPFDFGTLRVPSLRMT